jgi:hypothetical protein
MILNYRNESKHKKWVIFVIKTFSNYVPEESVIHKKQMLCENTWRKSNY